jgi:hypothetical protein
MEQISNDQTVAVKMVAPSQDLGTNAVVNTSVEVPTQTCQSSRSSKTCATIEVSSSREKFLPNEPTTEATESMMTARNDAPPEIEVETTGHRLMPSRVRPQGVAAHSGGLAGIYPGLYPRLHPAFHPGWPPTVYPGVHPVVAPFFPVRDVARPYSQLTTCDQSKLGHLPHTTPRRLPRRSAVPYPLTFPKSFHHLPQYLPPRQQIPHPHRAVIGNGAAACKAAGTAPKLTQRFGRGRRGRGATQSSRGEGRIPVRPPSSILPYPSYPYYPLPLFYYPPATLSFPPIPSPAAAIPSAIAERRRPRVLVNQQNGTTIRFVPGHYEVVPKHIVSDDEAHSKCSDSKSEQDTTTPRSVTRNSN